MTPRSYHHIIVVSCVVCKECAVSRAAADSCIFVGVLLFEAIMITASNSA